MKRARTLLIVHNLFKKNSIKVKILKDGAQKKKNLFRMEKKKKFLIFIKVDNIIEKKIIRTN